MDNLNAQAHAHNKWAVSSAIKWFEDNDIQAYEDSGSIYISVNEDTDIQISSAEVAYRADLQASEV